MDKHNDMAQLRYLEEIAISLKRAGYDIGQIEDRHLPVSWNSSYLCRISGKGSVLVTDTSATFRIKCGSANKLTQAYSLE